MPRAPSDTTPEGRITQGRDEGAMSGGRTTNWWLAAAACCAVFAAAVALTGGFEVHPFGVRLRSRGWERPALIAAVLFAMALAARSRDVSPRVWLWLNSPRATQALAVGATIWVIVAGVRYGTFSAGGADSYGYVSQAHLLARGQVTDSIPMNPAFTWSEAELTLIPLGYQPAAQAGRMSPIYPPGLPLLMAMVLPLGERLPYLLVPVFGGGAVLCVWLAGRRFGDPFAGALAAALLAVSPIFLLQLFSPMSDVPVTALWLVTLLCASRNSSGWALAAGVAAAVAVLVRPNLAPLAIVPAALIAVRGRRIRDLMLFAAPLALGVAAVLAVQFVRYGGAFRSGYGRLEQVFAVANVGPNVIRYPRWLTDLYTPVIWLCAIAAVRVNRAADRAFAAAAVALVALTWIAYLPYEPFEAWHSTRYLLPAIPFMLLGAVIVLLGGVRRLPVPFRPVVALAGAGVLAFALVDESRRHGVFEAGEHERRYPRAGAYVREHLPATAVVLASQHSGSVRMYGERLTVRWERVRGDQFDDVVRTLRSNGFEVYAVLDSFELPMFDQHFHAQSAVRRLKPLAEFGQARVYEIE